MENVTQKPDIEHECKCPSYFPEDGSGTLPKDFAGKVLTRFKLQPLASFPDAICMFSACVQNAASANR